MSLSDKALDIATKAHAGQFRRGGAPYISHPVQVAQVIDRVKGDSHKHDELKSASLLHDTREDTDLTDAEILEEFGPLVLSLVNEVTSDEEELRRLGKTEYLKKKLSGISNWALVIKLADRLTNLSDLMTAKRDWAIKYATQTREIIEYLKETRKLTSTQQQLIKEIEEILEEFFNCDDFSCH